MFAAGHGRVRVLFGSLRLLGNGSTGGSGTGGSGQPPPPPAEPLLCLPVVRIAPEVGDTVLGPALPGGGLLTVRALGPLRHGPEDMLGAGPGAGDEGRNVPRTGRRDGRGLGLRSSSTPLAGRTASGIISSIRYRRNPTADRTPSGGRLLLSTRRNSPPDTPRRIRSTACATSDRAWRTPRRRSGHRHSRGRPARRRPKEPRISRLAGGAVRTFRGPLAQLRRPGDREAEFTNCRRTR